MVENRQVTYGKLSQDVGSSPDADPNNTLKPKRSIIS